MARSRCRAVAAAVVLGAALVANEGHALEGAGGGWLGDSTGITVAMAAIDLLNLGTLVVNIAYLEGSEFPTKAAVLSYLGGGAGLVAGGLGATSDSVGVQAFGAATFALAVVTMGFTTWNIVRPREEKRVPEVVVAPSTIIDFDGQSVPAASIAGSF